MAIFTAMLNYQRVSWGPHPLWKSHPFRGHGFTHLEIGEGGWLFPHSALARDPKPWDDLPNGDMIDGYINLITWNSYVKLPEDTNRDCEQSKNRGRNAKNHGDST